MPFKTAFPTLSKIRFSVVHLLVLMTLIALFVFVLMNDNKWVLGGYSTLFSGIVLSILITAICARGEKQYFSLGFICCIPVYYLTVYCYPITLPYLITVELYELLTANSVKVPNEDHFIMVMTSFWLFVTSYGMGRLGQYWYRRAREERALTASDS